MGENFTSSQASVMVEQSESELNPKKETLNFIRQFARIVSFEPALNENLGVFIAN